MVKVTLRSAWCGSNVIAAISGTAMCLPGNIISAVDLLVNRGQKPAMTKGNDLPNFAGLNISWQPPSKNLSIYVLTY